MRSLSAADIVRIWEIGQGQHALDRALTLLAFACPEKSLAELAAFSIGQRDAYLLTVRELTFGPQLNSFAQCPHCQESLEFSVNVNDIRLSRADEFPVQGHRLSAAGLELQFRLPNSIDLAAVMAEGEAETAHSRLARRCLVKASRDGDAVAYEALPAAAIAHLSQQMAAADPQAEILLNLNCPACDHHWQALFDIVEFFWSELKVQAQRLLQEVYTLARASGWREADILAMSAMRRQYYLDMAT